MSSAKTPTRVRDDAALAYSSSPDLSSPPKSDSESPSSRAGNYPVPQSQMRFDGVGGVGGGGLSRGSVASTNNHFTATTQRPTFNNAGEPIIIDDTPPKKIKSAHAKPISSDSTSTHTRKKLKTSNSPELLQQPTSTNRQAKLADLFDPQRPPAPNGEIHHSADPATSRNGNIDAIHQIGYVYPQYSSARTSGQNYDPIRGGAAPISPTRPPSANRASASPSISSLIDPPLPNPTFPSQAVSQVPANNRNPVQNASISVPSSPSTIHVAQVRPSGQGNQATSNGKITGSSNFQASSKKATAGTSTTASSAAHSPKPTRQKEPPPPAPQGSGLLSSALFGGPTSAPSQEPSESRPPTIVIDIPMKGEVNQTVNFTQLAEKQYGFSALHPRIAAQRARLAQVAAAGAALERGSGTGSADDMSLDLSDPDSNAEMGGVDGDESTGKTRKKKRADEYNTEDPFIDDSETTWERNAAQAKDGFFVYSGLLVPAGEEAKVERLDGTVKRGRGRGRGGSTRGTTNTRGGSGAAATPRPRGSTVGRKPRITKAEKAMLGQQRSEREQVATLAAKPQTLAG
ncbi:MAG: hypothetical protein M1825_000638 [Sarcosagium campestre]|nr:MAG: hypothetical protein M1825_000638 [Sarcosagium campestre]